MSSLLRSSQSPIKLLIGSLGLSFMLANHYKPELMAAKDAVVQYVTSQPAKKESLAVK